MPVTVATSAGGISSSGPKSQQRAHTRDSRAAVGRRHLLYELERHPFEASPLTQLFAVLARRRPSWWSSSDQQPPPPSSDAAATLHGTSATTTTTATRPPASKSLRSATGTSSKKSGKKLMAPGNNTTVTSNDNNLNASMDSGGNGATHDHIDESNRNNNTSTAATTTVDPNDPCRDLIVPDTVVWETNIPKGWFTFDAKEQHVLRRKVETKAIQRAFLKGAKYADDVVAVLYCSDGAADSGEPAQQYQFITAAGLEGFLFEHGRGKGTAILQQFVPSLHAAMNDCIEAVWSPTVCHVSRRQNIHEIADERYDVNDRCVTFEAKTHLSRLVQSTSRLRAQVQAACESLVRHFHGCDTRHVITRLVCRFKMTRDSELNLLHCVSARVMRAATPSTGLRPGGGATAGDAAEPVDDLKAALRADDGSNSVFYRQYRVALDVAVNYTERPPPAVATESRSVLSRLQERNEAERRRRNEERRERERVEDEDDGMVVGDAPLVSQGRAATPSPLEPAPSKAVAGSTTATTHGRRPASAGGAPAEQHVQSDVTVAGQLASRRGFVVRPTRTADRQASLPADSTAKSKTPNLTTSASATSADRSGGGEDDLDAAAWSLVTSPEFEGYANAPAPQQRKVNRVLDRVVRTAGAASVRRALLQAHEEDLTDAERMELLGLMLLQQQQISPAAAAGAGGNRQQHHHPLAARLPRTWRRSDTDAKTREALRQAAESPTRGDQTTSAAWALTKQATEDATYPAYNDSNGGSVAFEFPVCPTAGPALLPKLAALVNDGGGSANGSAVAMVRDALLRQLDNGESDDNAFASSPSEAAAVVLLAAVLSSASCRPLREAGLTCAVGPAPHHALSIVFTASTPSRNASTRVCQRVTFAATELIAQLGATEGLPLRFNAATPADINGDRRHRDRADADADVDTNVGDALTYGAPKAAVFATDDSCEASGRLPAASDHDTHGTTEAATHAVGDACHVRPMMVVSPQSSGVAVEGEHGDSGPESQQQEAGEGTADLDADTSYGADDEDWEDDDDDDGNGDAN